MHISGLTSPGIPYKRVHKAPGGRDSTLKLDLEPGNLQLQIVSFHSHGIFSGLLNPLIVVLIQKKKVHCTCPCISLLPISLLIQSVNML